MVLSVINTLMDEGFAGMVLGVADGQDIESFTDNAETVPGVYDLVFTAANAHQYGATIYGIVVLSAASDGTGTAAEARDLLQAAILAQPALVLRVSAVDSGNNLRITELNPELYGPANITGLDADTAMTTITAHSQLEVVPFGVALVQGPNPHDCRLPHSGSVAADVVGFACHEHGALSALDPSDRAGYPPFASISTLKRGKMLGVFEDAVTLASTVFMRIAPGSGGTQRGALRTDADGGTAVTLAGKVKVRSVQATPGSTVRLQINLVP